ncbi:cytochrome c [Rhodopseudomonas palustris]|uniref:Cytochrome c n=1 Tax=Thiospirillum jenense TaxID=1653858 RepID=A0A839H828_9GAMM|nr:cytochrome c [Thiospirillum jenense]MBB1089700.1 cytochrome c [Rhodopseudomonas palustris]MBB1124800.1 cytochrome c [Thiospirillum jenense]
MNKMIQFTIAGLLGLGIVTAAVAADITRPEEQILTRQAGYKFMAWNMGKIKANLAGDYNQQQVKAAANTIAAIANSGMGALYGPGTDKNIGTVETRAKADIFTDKEKVIELARQFVTAANQLAEIATNGDKDAVKQAFGQVGQSCKSCHDKFRAD